MMKKEETCELTIEMPLYLWQSLVAMAAKDMRTEENFILWLIYRAQNESKADKEIPLATLDVMEHNGRRT